MSTSPLDYREEALRARAAGDTLLGVAVTTDDITEKASIAARASQHFAVAAHFEQLHFDSLTNGLTPDDHPTTNQDNPHDQEDD